MPMLDYRICWLCYQDKKLWKTMATEKAKEILGENKNSPVSLRMQGPKIILLLGI